jgi:glycosyltransferase involved in cell wall biosynthesis
MKQENIVTIIIAIYNGATTLERCLSSCFEQTYPYELIIIDGASSDSTIDILNNYSDKISYWISEPDNGIYNAWNKALEKATGDWICFIGCDDYWSSSNSLEKLSQHASYPEFNFVSSKMHLVSEGKTIKSVGRLLNCDKLMYVRVVHAGALHHRSLFENFGYFNETYKVAGDYEFLLRASSFIQPTFVPENLICMSINGISNVNFNLTIREGMRALRENSSFGIFAAIQLAIVSYLYKGKNLIFGQNK